MLKGTKEWGKWFNSISVYIFATTGNYQSHIELHTENKWQESIRNELIYDKQTRHDSWAAAHLER